MLVNLKARLATRLYPEVLEGISLRLPFTPAFREPQCPAGYNENILLGGQVEGHFKVIMDHLVTEAIIDLS